MSTAETGALTRKALESAGGHLHEIEVLRDIDEVADADAVAADAPETRFARTWR
jgi:glycosyltransferase A (GT-A) superfamily protein (DUF2064 family)